MRGQKKGQPWSWGVEWAVLSVVLFAGSPAQATGYATRPRSGSVAAPPLSPASSRETSTSGGAVQPVLTTDEIGRIYRAGIAGR